MQPIITVLNNVGNTIVIPNQLMFSARTYLTRDTVNSTSITVENPTDFSTSSRILVGEVGSENAEVQTLNTITAPTTTSPSLFTMATAYALNKYRGDFVGQLLYDQIVIEYSTTENGTYSTLATIPFNWTEFNTTYQHGVGLSTYFYRTKFKNSINSIETIYSQKVSPSTSALEPTPLAMIDSLRELLGISANDSTMTLKFFLEAINEARDITHTDYGNGRMKEWLSNFEYPIKMLAGQNFVDLPTDIDYNRTNRALLNARYSTNSVGSSRPIRYTDKADWNISSYQRRYSYVNGTINPGDVNVALDDTGDFPDQGTITVPANGFNGTPMNISYTANDKDTNILSGCTGIIRIVPDGVQAWSYQTNWYPMTYTVFDDKIWFDSVIGIQLNGVNLYIDYYKKMEKITDINEPFTEHYYSIYKNYLRFAIKRRRDDSIGETDPDYVRFITSVKEVQGTVFLGQNMRIRG